MLHTIDQIRLEGTIETDKYNILDVSMFKVTNCILHALYVFPQERHFVRVQRSKGVLEKS